jgi:hypothetical protein
MVLTDMQVDVLNTLGPEWLMVKVGAFGSQPTNPLNGLKRRGMVEIGKELRWRVRTPGGRIRGAMLVRLTPLGMECRDTLIQRRVDKLRRKTGL